MNPAIKRQQIQFHIDKAAQLTNELNARKSAGENRIWRLQQELQYELDRLQHQIDQHKLKVTELNESE